MPTLLLVLLLVLANLDAEASKKTKGQNSLESKCNAYQLKHKNCLLKSGPVQFVVTKDKINFFDGVDRQIINFPAAEDSVEWVNVILQAFNTNNTILQIKLWQDSKEVEKEPIGLQKLNWYVYYVKQNANSKALELAHHGVLQKKRKDNFGAKDPIKKHSVELNKFGQVVITQDSHQKVIEGR